MATNTELNYGVAGKDTSLNAEQYLATDSVKDLAAGISSVPASGLSREDYAARAGVDVSRVAGDAGSYSIAPVGAAPASTFQVGGIDVKAPGTSGIVGGSSNVSGEYDQINNDITAGLAKYGINPPEPVTMDDVITQTADIDKRREELRKRKEEDMARIEASYAAGKENLEIDQKESYDQAAGRSRIGGAINRMELDDLQKLERRNRLDLIAFEGQHQGALRDAQRAYEDGDYALARDKVQEAKDIENEYYKRQQDYFNNVVQFNNMSTPISRASESQQAQVTNWMEQYPDVFSKLSPVEMTNMSLQDAYNLALTSKYFSVGGIENYQKPKTSTNTSSGKPLSLWEINQIKANYGFTPPLGATMDQITQFIADNPGASPEELQAAVDQINAGDGGDSGSSEAGTTKTTLDAESFMKSFDINFLYDLAKKAGMSSWLQSKDSIVKRYINEVLMPRISDERFTQERLATAKANYSDEEIIDFILTGVQPK